MLAVGGCSYSSAFEILEKDTWPTLLSNTLETNLINESRIQGSNWRIWRTLTNHILNENLTPSDKIIIQYTEVHRKEIWSPIPVKPSEAEIQESYDGGKLLKWKFGAASYSEGVEKVLSSLLIKFSNDSYDTEVFKVQHNLFCSFLENKKFKNVYFLTSIYNQLLNNSKIHNSNYKVIDITNLSQHHLPGDKWHLSTTGHRQVADRILNFIQA